MLEKLEQEAEEQTLERNKIVADKMALEKHCAFRQSVGWLLACNYKKAIVRTHLTDH
jgi:hypothetical protein